MLELAQGAGLAHRLDVRIGGEYDEPPPPPLLRLTALAAPPRHLLTLCLPPLPLPVTTGVVQGGLRLKGISGGERRRLALVACQITDPCIMFLDGTYVGPPHSRLADKLVDQTNVGPQSR